MVNMKDLLDLQVEIFLLMAAGYVLTKLGVLPVSARRPLTDLVIDFILPCNIIVSFMIEFNARVLAACLAVLLVSAGIQLFTMAAGRLFYPHAGADELAVLQYGTLVSNAGFLGSPIVEGLYGAQGLLYASVYLIPQRIMMWSAGVSCFTGLRGRGVLKKVATHPCIVAVGIGLAVMLLQLPLPSGLETALRAASGCTTALSMMVIGNILAEIDPRSVISAKALWYCAVRLVLLPLLVLAACRLLRLDALVAEVSTVLAGMPAAATTAMLAAKYGKGEHFAVSLVFLSTLLSLVSIPALCFLMRVV